MMGSPSQRDFEGMVHHNLIKKCPIDNKVSLMCLKYFGQNWQKCEGRLCKKPNKGNDWLCGRSNGNKKETKHDYFDWRCYFC